MTKRTAAASVAATCIIAVTATLGMTSATAAPRPTATSSRSQLSDEQWAQVRAAFDEDMARQGITVDRGPVFDDAGTQNLSGVKGAAAKAAVKGAIKALKGIGKKAWTTTIDRLPIPGPAKKFLGYDLVLRALNIAVNVEGSIEDMIAAGLGQVGVPGWLGGIVARTITTVLL